MQETSLSIHGPDELRSLSVCAYMSPKIWIGMATLVVYNSLNIVFEIMNVSGMKGVILLGSYCCGLYCGGSYSRSHTLGAMLGRYLVCVGGGGVGGGWCVCRALKF